MIGWKHDHKSIVILFVNVHGSKSYTRSRISSNRFAQNVLLRKIRQLFLCQCFIIAVCYNVNIFHIYQWQNTIYRMLDHGNSIIRQTQKLFWQILTAFWPKTLATSTCHDHCCNFHSSSFPLKFVFIILTLRFHCYHGYNTRQIRPAQKYCLLP